MGYRLLLFLVLGVLLTPPLQAEVAVKTYTFQGDSRDDEAAYKAQALRIWGSGQYPKDPGFLSKLITMDSGSMSYAIWCRGRTDDSGVWRMDVGMLRPSRANWYANGFYDVTIKGKGLSKYPAKLVAATGGSQGTVVVQWDHPAATVTLTLTMLDGDDKLLLKTTVAAKDQDVGFEVKLHSFPSSYAAGFEPGMALRQREARTSQRVLKRPAKEKNLGYINATLEKTEPWILFYDTYFDVAEHRGAGPCAVYYDPDKTGKVRVTVANYSCDIRLEYPASASQSHLIVWDLHGLTNEAAEKYMEALVVKPKTPESFPSPAPPSQTPSK